MIGEPAQSAFWCTHNKEASGNNQLQLVHHQLSTVRIRTKGLRMSQRTLFAMPRFTREQPPVKKSKKRRRAKDGSSIEQVVELQVEDNITGSSNDGSNASKVDDKDFEVKKELRRLAWNPSWAGSRGAFEWAEFDPVSAGMFCKYCKQVNNSRSEFGKNGSTNVQHSALTEHAGTKAHRDAHYMFGKNKITIEDGVEKRQDVAMVSSKRLFAAAYHVAKEDLAFNIATCQHMIVYASFIEDSDPVTVFLGLLEVAEVLQMSRIHKVRWLSRSMCVHKVCESLEELLVFLKEHNSSLFDKVKDFQFIYSLHFMADILQRLAMLSKIFQSTFVDITAVVGLIEAEMRLITSQFIEVPIVDINAFVLDGLDYPMIPDYGPRNGQLAALRASIRGNMYRSVELERAKCGKDMDAAISFQRQFSQFIVANLRQRFPDMGVLSSFKALSPCCFPAGIAYRNFGYDMTDNLLSFYGEPKVLHGEIIDPLVSKVNAKREYDVFREQAPYEWKGRGLKDVWLSIGRNPTTREKYTTLLKLAELAMLQCASTAACKRGFSVQNLIKTRLRSHLSTRNLDALMRVSIEGPPLRAYAFEDAIKLWRNGAKTSRHLFSESKRMNGVFMEDRCISLGG